MQHMLITPKNTFYIPKRDRGTHAYLRIAHMSLMRIDVFMPLEKHMFQYETHTCSSVPFG